MKKGINKKISSLIFAFLLVMMLFAGQSVVFASTEGDSSDDIARFYSIVGKEEMLYDYEELSDFQEINATPGFGLTKMNTDSKYVKSGIGSMHVRVDAYEEFYHFPEKLLEKRQLIEMYPNWYFETKSDYSDTLAFRLDVYNVSDRDIKIGLLIQTTQTKVVLGPEIAVRNCWNELVFEVDFEKSIYQGFDSITTISYVFENRVWGQTAAECYLDNFRRVKSTNKSTKLNYIPELTGDMICDFEDKYFELSSLNKYTSYPNIGPYDSPKISINTDPQFVKGGTKSFKIERYPSRYNHALFPEWSDVFPLSDEYMLAVNWEKYDTTSSYIYMDVYSDYDENVMMRVYCLDGASQGLLKDTNLAPNSWTTVKIPMYDEYMDWGSLATFNIMFRDFYGVETSTVYVDNIRLVESYV